MLFIRKVIVDGEPSLPQLYHALILTSNSLSDEEEAENIFARRRVTFECNVELLERETEDWRRIMLLFDQREPELMETLRRLMDFQLLRLRAKSGVFVKGFGKTYKISGARMDELSHVNPRKQN